jgi:hypothetical protein
MNTIENNLQQAATYSVLLEQYVYLRYFMFQVRFVDNCLLLPFTYKLIVFNITYEDA